ncbi:MAG: hypothetical protein Ct9H90mP11_06220 [Acidimicrobiales bacterium]|nr:MAG: hypothetical protein Ct9H90mP11_06220 [Acidimicrobiales bacterium]
MGALIRSLEFWGKKVGDTIKGKRKPVSSTLSADMDITPEQVLRIALQTARNQERFSPETIRRSDKPIWLS